MAALTLRMVISSLLGWVTVGVAITAFIPLIVMNAVQRRNGTGPWFLGVWLVADAINVAGLIYLGAQPTQIILAVWYVMADSALTIELVFFGHSDWGTRDPRRVRDLIRRVQRHETPWWFRLTTHLRNFSVWDDFVLLSSVVLLCTTAWGGFMLAGMWGHPDTFSIDIPHEWSTKAFALGITASLIFSLARIPEFLSGERRSRRNVKPEHDIKDPLFALLIIENFFNLGSIFALSKDLDYLKVESPWIIGSLLSILFDGILIWRVTVWRKCFFRPGNPEYEKIKHAEEQRDHKRKALKDEAEELEEEWVLQDILRDAEQPEEKVPEDAGYFEKRRIEKKNKQLRGVKKEYLKHESAPEIQRLHGRIARRAATAAHHDYASKHYDDHVRKAGHDTADHTTVPVQSDGGDPYDSSGSDKSGEMTQLNRRTNPVVEHYHPRLGTGSRRNSTTRARQPSEDST